MPNTPTPDERTMNQCDGCRRGLPLENGIHRAPGHGTSVYDLIGCTANRYAAPDERAVNDSAPTPNPVSTRSSLVIPDERARLIEELRKNADLATSSHGYPFVTVNAHLLTRAADQLALAGEDSKRLNWLDKTKKQRHHATWDGGGPAYWVDPSVSWEIHHGAKCGTYTFPPELDALSLREAIDSAISATQKETG